MRKLGIVIAIAAAATLGLAGTASAQSPETIQEGVVDVVKSVGCPLEQGPIDGGSGECDDHPDLTPDQEGITTYVCGVTNAVLDGVENNGGGELSNAIKNDLGPLSEQYQANCAAEAGGGGNGGGGNGGGNNGGGNNGGGGGGGGDVDDTVKANNATDDGGLPRTGGELFAGAGLGLAGLGSLIRRFLP